MPKKNSSWNYYHKILIVGTSIWMLLFSAIGNIYAQEPEEESFNRGKDYFKKQKYEEALIAFDAAIHINPKYADAYFYRGVVYADRYKFDEALLDYAKAIEIDPNLSYVYVNRAMVYFLIKEYDKSWEDTHKAESLGYKVDEKFLESLKKASNRGN
ncbi:MAG: tetratricopeptide repeat protein [Candidatus Omnitrophica bacterium]|nr:tetratricopeptide repeat protein [Candidatus Omnitrophota bacterium]